MALAGARICIVTAGHLATAPRMLKAADALAGAGCRVRVVSTRFLDWADEADREVRATRSWAWTAVDYRRDSAEGRRTYLRSGVRFRLAQAASRLALGRPPAWIAIRAYARVHRELVKAALAEPADLYYGGSTGALAATAAAGHRAGVPYALDLEDFHTAEQDDSRDARLAHRLARRVELEALPGAAFLTAAGASLAAAYHETYRLLPIAVNNTFPLPAVAPDSAADSASEPPAAPDAPLRLYWFSQTIGPGRGLEDAVRAMGLLGIPGELHLRGRRQPGYLEGLTELAAAVAPDLRIVHHEPAPPDRMIELCRGYAVGLATEQGHVLSRALCLSNKPLTYILAGLPVAFTDTPGQRELARDLGPGAFLYKPGDAAGLAAGLDRWAEDRSALAAASAAAWEAAKRRWHWEHESERGALLAAVDKALDQNARTR